MSETDRLEGDTSDLRDSGGGAPSDPTPGALGDIATGRTGEETVAPLGDMTGRSGEERGAPLGDVTIGRRGDEASTPLGDVTLGRRGDDWGARLGDVTGRSGEERSTPVGDVTIGLRALGVVTGRPGGERGGTPFCVAPGTDATACTSSGGGNSDCAAPRLRTGTVLMGELWDVLRAGLSGEVGRTWSVLLGLSGEVGRFPSVAP